METHGLIAVAAVPERDCPVATRPKVMPATPTMKVRRLTCALDARLQSAITE
jgi:hypothetical protein